MTAPLRPNLVIERWGRVAPLGVRCRDPLTGQVISDLTVEAWPAAEPHRRLRAFTSAGGVYGWLDLPRVRERTFGLGDDAYWKAQPPPLEFVIEVRDDRDRYLSFRVRVLAPARGVWRWACEPGASPPAALDAVPLHASPARVVPPATLAIRAELRDTRTGGPAAWAIVEARIVGSQSGTVIGRGMADRVGRMLLLAPWPEPLPRGVGATAASPPGASRVPLWEQRWPVELDVSYQPAALGEEVPEVPDLCDALVQGPAIAWADRARTVPLDRLEIGYGRELVARTEGAEGTLLVTPAGSPP
jgi:hypothetical protein